MELGTVRAEVEDEVGRQRGLHVEIENRQPRLRVHVKTPGEEVTDEVFEECPRGPLVPILCQVDEAEEAYRRGVNDSRDAVGIHVRSAFGGNRLPKYLPPLRVREKKLLVYRP